MHVHRTAIGQAAGRSALAALLAVTTAATMLAAAAPAQADDVIASASDEVIAAAGTSAARPAAGTVAAPAITAAASGPRAIVVTNHGRRPVSLYAKGERRRAVKPASTRAVRFGGLTPGRTYVVVVGGAELGRLTAVDRPHAATALTVRRGADAGTVSLTWRHTPTAATGGRGIWYDVTATSPSAPTLRTRVTGARTAHLAGLSQSALYSFTVVPRNTAGAGRAVTARMTRPLTELRAEQTPTATSTAPAPAPTPTPTPAPAAPAPAAPATRTVWVCPGGTTAAAGGLCLETKAYTYTRTAYTFHTEVVAPAPILDEYSTSVRACPGGYNLEDYGWVLYCRRYGAAKTAEVKDDLPAGFTDDGTQWVRKDAAPAGFTDDGEQWIRIVPKVSQVVPA